MANAKKHASSDAAAKRKLAQASSGLAFARGKNLSLKQLKQTADFAAYARLLKAFAKRYTVMAVACDTPCGPDFVKEHSLLMQDIGFTKDLCGKYRHGYAALIDAGELLFEELAPSVVECRIDLDGTAIDLLSVGFNAARPNAGLVNIGGQNHSPCGRGLNFVVYDKVTGFLLDAVNFDTYGKNFPCHRPSELVDGVKLFCARHPDVRVVNFNLPLFPQEKQTDNERFIQSNAVGRVTILNSPDKSAYAIHRYYPAHDIAELLTAPQSYHDIDGVRRFEDYEGSRVHTVGGHRITAGQPKNRKRTVFLVGGCNIFGIGAADEDTVASFLQSLLNENAPEQALCVQNYGFYLAEMGDAQSGEELAILHSLPVNPGDIVLWNFSFVPGLPFIDLAQAAAKPRTFEIFGDTMHFTPDGYRLIAEELFSGLQAQQLLAPHLGGPQANAEQRARYGFSRDANSELEAYKQTLADFYRETLDICVGAIVMNCNPFTLGHRYLIEQALGQCHYLVVFVVEEDQSVFPFDERFQLVTWGTEDLANLIIVPSGRFIISSLTFSDYFNKSEIQERDIDASLDVTIFAREIAPCLHITKRFAGEEPFDNITRQYNESMRRVLPEYGIQFIEIPRKTQGDTAISASRVRALLAEKDFEGIKPLVPQTTYDYLMEGVGKQSKNMSK